MQEIIEVSAGTQSHPRLGSKLKLCPVDIISYANLLIDVLSGVEHQHAELHRLYVETQWLKINHEQRAAVLTIHELMILQIARGEISPALKPYPQVVVAAAALGWAVQRQYITEALLAS